jgi:hypothetical protein
MKLRGMTVLAVAAMLAVAGGVGAKNSGKLPKGAVPLSAEEVHALYDGKSINWKPTVALWKADGSVMGYYPVKGEESFADGTWTVKDNEWCYHMEWRGKDKTKAPYVEDACQTLFRAGKKLWVVNTKDQDKYQGDVWTGLEKKLTSKDLVTAKYTALKAKFGY